MLVFCYGPIFKYGNKTESSATPESLFKDLKHIMFKHKSLPVRVDEFMNIHVNSIIGETNILGSKLNNKNNEKLSSNEKKISPKKL